VRLPNPLLRGLTFACVALSAATAAAQSGAAEPGPRAGDEGEAPAAARTNVFFEAAIGPGWLHVGAGSEDDERTLKGVTLATELALGGKISRRVAIGAAYIRDDSYELSARDELIDGDEPALDGVTTTFGMLAFFTDWHPIADDGIHLRAAIGIGTMSASYPNSAQLGGGTVDDGDGLIGWSFGVGYHRRVAGTFSVGVLARLNLADYEHQGNRSAEVIVATPSLLLTLGAH
jgi:hypothetical protein